MSPKRKSTGIDLYYEALEKVFDLQASVLTRALPHLSEQGSNHEEFLKNFLKRVLPKKYSVDTGFIVSANSALPLSSQTDIIIADEYHNAPIHREFAASIYPVEAVYATIEVKAKINQTELRKALVDIAKIRRMGREKRYAQYGRAPVDKEKLKLVVNKTAMPVSLPPRAYIFAYDASWRSPDAVANFLCEELKTHNSFLHGLTVLRKKWHFTQTAYADGVKIETFLDKPLARFSSTLLDGINSMTMRPVFADPYLRL